MVACVTSIKNRISPSLTLIPFSLHFTYPLHPTLKKEPMGKTLQDLPDVIQNFLW